MGRRVGDGCISSDEYDMMVPNESQLIEERKEPLLVKAESKLNFVQPFFFFLGGGGVPAEWQFGDQ